MLTHSGTIGAAGAVAAGPPATWDLTVTTTDVDQTWSIDIFNGNTPNIDVVWGDTASNNYTTTGIKTHSYAAAGTYTVSISGSFASGGIIKLGTDGTDRPRLKSTSIIPMIPGLRSFKGCFQNCTGLTGSIPADLFRYNPLVSEEAFSATFSGCTGLTGAIPVDLFKYNTAADVYAFYSTFDGCSELTGAIPADLFRYNTAVTTNGFAYTFYGCSKLQVSPNIFFQPGEETTRFLNRVSSFANCFKNSSTGASQGTAPALWNCDFGTETPTTTSCFSGHSLSTLTNYADIPEGWR